MYTSNSINLYYTFSFINYTGSGLIKLMYYTCIRTIYSRKYIKNIVF